MKINYTMLKGMACLMMGVNLPYALAQASGVEKRAQPRLDKDKEWDIKLYQKAAPYQTAR